ncbi:putative fkbp-type peptidyl-prolyl cis-trans isomerase,related protein [Toxoplasma gondii p89]|nr:putative fkbp-type peptidyl-prolyl cis-trans isomerase,related protein [Toxoplasma gondii p89]
MDHERVSGLRSHPALSVSLPHCVPPCLPSCLRPLSSSTTPSSSSTSSSGAPNDAEDLEDVCGDRSVLLLHLSRAEKTSGLPSSPAHHGHFPNPFLAQTPFFGNLGCVSAVVWAIGDEPPELTPEALRLHKPPETPEFLITKRLVRIGGSEIPPGVSDALLRMTPGDLVRVFIHPDKGFKDVYPRTLRQAVTEDDFFLADICLHYWTLFENLTPSPLLASCPLNQALPWASPPPLARFASSPGSSQLCRSSPSSTTPVREAGENPGEAGTEQHRVKSGDNEEGGKEAGVDIYPKNLVLFFAYDRLKRDNCKTNIWRDAASNISFSYHTFTGPSATDSLDLARVQVAYALPRPHSRSSSCSPSPPPSPAPATAPRHPDATSPGRTSPVSSPPSSTRSPALFHASATTLEEDETTPEVFEFLLDEEEAPYRGIEILVRSLRVGQAGDAWLSGQFAEPGEMAGNGQKEERASNCEGERSEIAGDEGVRRAEDQQGDRDRAREVSEKDGQERETTAAGQHGEAAVDHRNQEAGCAEKSGDKAGSSCAEQSTTKKRVGKAAYDTDQEKLPHLSAASGGPSTAGCPVQIAPGEKRAHKQEDDAESHGCNASERQGEDEEETGKTTDDAEAQKSTDGSPQCCRLLRGFVVRGVYPLPEPHHLATPEKKISMAKFIRENGNGWFRKRDFPRALRRYLMSEKYLEYLGGAASHRDTLRARPDLHAVRLNAAQCYIELSNFDQARTFCEKVLKEDPVNVKGLWRLSVALAGQEDYLEAEKIARQALTVQPQSSEILQWLKCLKRRGKVQDERLLGGFKGIFCSSEKGEIEATN